MDDEQDWRPQAELSAQNWDIDPLLVKAVVLTESSGNIFAVRHEPSYKWLFKPVEVRPAGSTLETEIVFQKTSWGLMQIMGAVAREYGFRGWLPELCTPAKNLEYGCRYLQALIKRFGGEREAVSAYNQGSPRRNADGKFLNQGYVDKVFKRRLELKAASH